MPSQRCGAECAHEGCRVALSKGLRRLRKVVDSRFFKRWGSSERKKAIWDQEFGSGDWRYLDSTRDDAVYGYLARHCAGGTILDLGCGSGNTANELDDSAYSQYLGVDVSEKAILMAIARSRRNGREAKNRYVCADVERFVPDARYEVVLFRESLFYVPVSKVLQLLERYRQYLTKDGVFIVRMCSREKHRAIVRRIERHYTVLESSPRTDANVILVFR